MLDEINPIRLPVLIGILTADPMPPLFMLRDPAARCDLKTKECQESFTFFVTNGFDFYGYETFKIDDELENYDVIKVEDLEEAGLIIRAYQGEFSGNVPTEPDERE